MHRITIALGLLVATLVIAYAGWLSAGNSANPTDSEGNRPDQTSQTDQNNQTGKPGENK